MPELTDGDVVYTESGGNLTAKATELDDDTNVVTAAQARSHIDDTSNPHAVTAAQASAVPTSDVGAASGVASLDANTELVIPHVRIVQHGDDPSVARPSVPLVHWYGSAVPTNGADGDAWDDLRPPEITDYAFPWLNRHGKWVRSGQAPTDLAIPWVAQDGLEALYLMEIERRNLLTHSEDFAEWSDTNVAVAANDDTDPFGREHAAKLTASAGNGTVIQSISGLSGSHTFSIYLKRDTGSGDVDLTIDNGSTWVTKTLTSSWQRFSVTGTPSGVGVRIVTGNGNHAHLGSSGVAFINPVGGAKALNLAEGLSSNNAESADTAANSVTGDIDVRAHINPGLWSGRSGRAAIIGKWGDGNERAYYIRLDPDGKLRFTWSADGTSTPEGQPQSTTAVPFADGEAGWIRATVDMDNGSSQWEATFYTSEDGVTWTQLGSTVTGGAVGSIYDGTDNLQIGQVSGVFTWDGQVYRAQVYDGIDGTLVADFNAEDAHGDVTQFYSSTTGELWTINQSAATTNDPSWTGEGLDFDGTDDNVTGFPSIADEFAVEAGTWTLSPTDYTTTGAYTGVLNLYAIYSSALSTADESQNERAAKHLLANRGVNL